MDTDLHTHQSTESTDLISSRFQTSVSDLKKALHLTDNCSGCYVSINSRVEKLNKQLEERKKWKLRQTLEGIEPTELMLSSLYLYHLCSRSD